MSKTENPIFSLFKKSVFRFVCQFKSFCQKLWHFWCYFLVIIFESFGNCFCLRSILKKGVLHAFSYKASGFPYVFLTFFSTKSTKNHKKVTKIDPGKNYFFCQIEKMMFFCQKNRVFGKLKKRALLHANLYVLVVL